MPATIAHADQVNAGQTPSGISFSELESQIDALVLEHIGLTTPGLAIVVVHEGEIIFSRGYGYADIENRVPFDPATTISRHGSVNKMFVWTAAMQLAELGLLDLDADVANYLTPDDISLFNFEKPFTMRNLMNHSAGFAETFYNMQSENAFDWQSFDVIDGLLASQPSQIFSPGTASSYSNWGTAFAAYIISQISGLSFADYNLKNILLPAGMENTLDEPLWTGNHDFMQNLAKGYRLGAGGNFREDLILHLGGVYPAGSSMGTAEDLARFIIALTPEKGTPGPLFENRLTLDTMFTLSSSDPINHPSFYHGFVRSGVMDSIGHSGGILGFGANLGVVPEKRFGWVILTNTVGEFDITFGLTHLLVENTAGQVLPVSDNLPDASAVEGLFVPLRRTQNSFLDFVSYMVSRITALDENTIRLSFGGFNTDFVQIEPYVFRLISSDSPAMYASLRELRFRMENGKPVHIYATGADFTALPSGRTIPFLISYLSIIIASALFFLIMPIVLLIIFLTKKKKGRKADKTKFRLLTIGIMLCGLLILINNILNIILGFATLAFNAASVNPHIWINYLLVGFSVLIFAGSMIFLHKERESIGVKSRVLFGITTILFALLTFTLINWNFFVFL